MNVDDIKERVMNLGYYEDRIKETYFSGPSVPFEGNLVSIQSDEEVRGLIKLCLKNDYMSIYVKHNDDENDKGKEVLVNQDTDEDIGVDLDEEAYFSDKDEFDDEYDSDEWFNSDDDNRKFIEIMKEKRTTKEAIAAELEIVRTGTMTTIIDDYKANLGQIRNYPHEVYKKNYGTTVKVKTFKEANDQHVKRQIQVKDKQQLAVHSPQPQKNQRPIQVQEQNLCCSTHTFFSAHTCCSAQISPINAPQDITSQLTPPSQPIPSNPKLSAPSTAKPANAPPAPASQPSLSFKPKLNAERAILGNAIKWICCWRTISTSLASKEIWKNENIYVSQ
ncbi:hypothetical protein Cgig2_014717 [Carnegiea gigantea]|uniref:Uncharacterized protein n=1 Tax=Carnegiea gigantea TaxID=171969 RepID=A0A9Q1QSX3_9CARY|nr:hypothetical protein Cgig2_014717 [Carnegiea gigantea]